MPTIPHISQGRKELSLPPREAVGMAESWQTEWFHRQKVVAGPFLKWAGGKRRILEKLLARLAPIEQAGTYYEPFLGSGAVFFGFAPARATLSDLNPALIESYRLVKARPRELCAFLGTLPPTPSRDQYYTLREQYNAVLAKDTGFTAEESLVLGSLFIWLNHTCFNGLYRVNRAGQFNVPIGSSPGRYIYDEATISRASRALRAAKASLLCADYKTVLTKAREGDIAYLDPPYESSDEAGFTGYTAKGFSLVDQASLAETVCELASRAVRVVVSNVDSPVVRRLYKEFEIHPISAPRSISRDPRGRGRVREVIIVA